MNKAETSTTLFRSLLLFLFYEDGAFHGGAGRGEGGGFKIPHGNKKDFFFISSFCVRKEGVDGWTVGGVKKKKKKKNRREGRMRKRE